MIPIFLRFNVVLMFADYLVKPSITLKENLKLELRKTFCKQNAKILKQNFTNRSQAWLNKLFPSMLGKLESSRQRLEEA